MAVTLRQVSAIEKKIDAWLQTDKAQKRVRKILPQLAMKQNTVLNVCKQLADDMLETLKRYLPKNTQYGSGIEHIFDGVRGRDIMTPPVFENDKWTFWLKFPEDLIWRDSLLAVNKGDAYRTGEGVDNIIRLFNNGYHISIKKHAVPYGYWSSKSLRGQLIGTKAKEYRPPLFFMQKAAGDFNGIAGQRAGKGNFTGTAEISQTYYRKALK